MEVDRRAYLHFVFTLEIKELNMDNDDRPVGKILTRREIISLMGLTGAAVLAACVSDEVPPTAAPATATSSLADLPTTAAATEAVAAEATSTSAGAAAAPVCVVRPELTEGPYFVDLEQERSDIRTNSSDGTERPGLRFDLAVLVSGVDADGCNPLEGAMVDVWHCDAEGAYSGVSDPGFSTAGEDFLRGAQITDASGRAVFTTIYPGWYSGRAVHIHFKIRYPEGPNGTYEFTSQFFFDDDFSAQVYLEPPYAARGTQNTLNSSDGIYGNGGSQLILLPVESGDGLAAEFSIALDLTNAAVGGQD
jgi:protocatechuate 3,4-dioxygenase beta subunit